MTGHERRVAALAAAAVARRAVADDEALALHVRHVAGESVLAIAKATGYTRKSITGAWSRLGLPWRGRSAAMYQRMAKTDVAERKRLASAAHEAVRGKKLPTEHIVARQRAVSGRSLSRYERVFADALRAAGVAVEPNFLVERFLIDVAIPERMIAIEIDGGRWHSSQPKRAQDARKEAVLRNLGWDVIRLEGRTEHRFITHAADVVAWLNGRGPRPPRMRVNASKYRHDP